MARMKTQAEFDRDVFNQTGFEYIFLEEYKGSNVKLKVIHMTCGHKYEVRPSNFLDGRRCPECANNQGGRRKTTEEVRQEIYDLVGDEFELVGEYVNSKTNITLIHRVCGEYFETRTGNFRKRRSCPKCKESVGEHNIRLFLEGQNIKYEREKGFDGMVNVGNLRVDFYLPEYNLAIEFEGEQHYSHQEYFGTKEQYERMLENDAIKKEYCIANGINYLEIPYVYRGQEGKIIQEYIDKIIETKIKEEPKKAKPTKIVYIPSGTQLEHIHLIEEEPKNERLTPEQIEIREQELELKMAYIELQKQKQGMI